MSIKKLAKGVLGKKLTKKIRPLGHGLKTYFSAFKNSFPADKLYIIGITGTKGKTSTTTLTGRLFNRLGEKAGYISTGTVYLGEGEEFLNPHKMTTIDGGVLHKYLKTMVKNGCKYAVLEMSSQGLEQNRHLGLGGFDLGVFLNLFPEHLEAHGGIENYEDAKFTLFKNIKKRGLFLGNSDNEYTQKMSSRIPDKKGVEKHFLAADKDYKIVDNKYSLYKSLKIGKDEVKTNFFASFEVVNLAFAVNIVKLSTGLEVSEILSKAGDLGVVPGRMEFVAQSDTLDIMVDYAHEPESMRQLLKNLRDWKDRGLYNYIIHVVSCDGVGRDDWKKPVLGSISYENADFTVVTTDNYEKEDNPEEIVNILSRDFDPQTEGKKYIKETNRKKAFEKAIKIGLERTLKNEKVIIVSTGVGVENGLTQPDGVMDWSEKEVWQELWNELKI